MTATPPKFHPATQAWLDEVFDAPTRAQTLAWPEIQAGHSTLLLAPTGSGKTLAAFLVAIDRALFSETPGTVLYISPLKALAVDVERNLRAPLQGILRCAERLGIAARSIDVAIRTGDTDAKERVKQARKAPDIWITTPESLFLLLTSNARESLANVSTVIVDEIHAIAPTKRGAHLFLSLERLEAFRKLRRPDAKPVQRVGLSATQRSIDEVARLLGGGSLVDGRFVQRHVAIADARMPPSFDLSVEVLVEDMAALGDKTEGPLGESKTTSIWASIHPRLVELIRAHRTTMIFVNSRRLAERLASDINELAGEELALAHHGSLAREQRLVVEDRLKRGLLPAIVATSSLELGLDLGAVELVLQIESPPSVASGLQRVGRANHHVGGRPKAVIFPKHRADLMATAAIAPRMLKGLVESTRYPRNPLDVLAQQLVAIVSMEDIGVDDALALVRGAANFAELAPSVFEGVLDMLSGRYPAESFSTLKPRITWDRTEGVLKARQGAKRLAVMNAGVIPDRGLYGVFLADGGNDAKRSRRVGELDEEFVFESREGEIFYLGASSWRITEISRDRVLVEPAPGQPGKMPFWHGDQLGRSAEAGEALGAFVRDVSSELLSKRSEMDIADGIQREGALDANAATNLIRYIAAQIEVTSEPPTDRTIIIERFEDELGDFRICILSPWGARVHAPLAIAMSAIAREQLHVETEAVWTDDGIVLRFPETDVPPDILSLFPSAADLETLLIQSLSSTSLFAARFRECAGRALLLPKKTVGKRQPLWAQRKRAQDLLAIASKFPAFPIVLEAYRECLEDAFDVAALRGLLERIERREVALRVVDCDMPSPFARSILFSYVANFMYDGDAPLAERRAQALTIDVGQLEALLGKVDLAAALDTESVAIVAERLQSFGARLLHEDAVHDLLLYLGDLSTDEIASRARQPEESIEAALARIEPLAGILVRTRRAVKMRVAGESRLVAAEDVARYRDALGCMIPPGLADIFLERAAQPLTDLIGRYARSHAPFPARAVGLRFGLGLDAVTRELDALVEKGRLIRGHFSAGEGDVEYSDPDVLKQLKRRSLAALRREIEPVPPSAYARFLLRWHELDSDARMPRGEGALLDVIERLEGLPLPTDALFDDVLPSRIEGFRPSDLDVLVATGAVVWRGVDASAGRIALHLTSARATDSLMPAALAPEGPLETGILDTLRARGAVFFHDIVSSLGTGLAEPPFPPDVAEALWQLVWKGQVTNDTLIALRSRMQGTPTPTRERSARIRPARVPRSIPGTEGRWSLLPRPEGATHTTRTSALARVLLERHGVFLRESRTIEEKSAELNSTYEVLRTLEEAGQIRRGFFVADASATQFAVKGTEDLLRSLRDASPKPRTLILSAVDPAQPYGATLPWPANATTQKPQRASGAQVILHDGALVGWMGKSEETLVTFVPEHEPARTHALEALVDALVGRVRGGSRASVLLQTIDGERALTTPLGRLLVERGFKHASNGLILRNVVPRA